MRKHPISSFPALFTARLGLPDVLPRTTLDGPCTVRGGGVCTLCHAGAVEYDREYEARNHALREFAGGLGLLPVWRPLVESPQGRRYRTISKRKVFRAGGRAMLGLIVKTRQGNISAVPVESCLLEPPGHAEVFRIVRENLEMPYAKPLPGILRHVVVRGEEQKFAVVFTVSQIGHGVMHALNTLSKRLVGAFAPVSSVLVYLDTSDGRYYFGAKDPSQRPHYHRLFGSEWMTQTIGGVNFVHHVFSFSQVNSGTTERLTEILLAELIPKPLDHVFDIYCGYGLFSLVCAPRTRSALGIDQSAFSIESARKNVRRRNAAHVRFRRDVITPDTVLKHLAPCTTHDVVILDPPRNGPAAGVIESIAFRKPARVAHLFCAIEHVPKSIETWKRQGYDPVSVTPFDMFPGTNDVELLAVFRSSACPS
ncbi:MAG: methyltransferase [Bacteroidota bacterium]|nr:methyltransferase [Bacteroidota bacterium]